jgi:hypothetical protein
MRRSKAARADAQRPRREGLELARERVEVVRPPGVDYHDHGHISIKLLDADEADIAGQDRANSGSMRAALQMAAVLA